MMRDASGVIVDGKGKPVAGQFIRKHCKQCRRFRKYEVGTPRYTSGICGNCWNWGHDFEKSLNT